MDHGFSVSHLGPVHWHEIVKLPEIARTVVRLNRLNTQKQAGLGHVSLKVGDAR